jgi:hypothetical protein
MHTIKTIYIPLNATVEYTIKYNKYLNYFDKIFVSI